MRYLQRYFIRERTLSIWRAAYNSKKFLSGTQRCVYCRGKSNPDQVPNLHWDSGSHVLGYISPWTNREFLLMQSSANGSTENQQIVRFHFFSWSFWKRLMKIGFFSYFFIFLGHVVFTLYRYIISYISYFIYMFQIVSFHASDHTLNPNANLAL